MAVNLKGIKPGTEVESGLGDRFVYLRYERLGAYPYIFTKKNQNTFQTYSFTQEGIFRKAYPKSRENIKEILKKKETKPMKKTTQKTSKIDLTGIKVGDKVKTRGGIILIFQYLEEDVVYPYIFNTVSGNCAVSCKSNGKYCEGRQDINDIVEILPKEKKKSPEVDKVKVLEARVKTLETEVEQLKKKSRKIELKPCPFCGGEPNTDGYSIYCGCGANMPGVNIDPIALGELWNARYTPGQFVDYIE